MLSQLLESSPRRARSHYSTLASIVGHVMALSGAVVAAHPVLDAVEPDPVIAWHPPAPPPPPCDGCASRPRGGSRGEGGVPAHPFPGRIPGEITLDISESIEPIDDGVVISGDEWRRDAPTERVGTTEPGIGRAVVDREVVPFPTNPVPRYPAELRMARLEGRVYTRFVVDTTGRVIMRSVLVDTADHPAFADAVIEALRRSRFQPAEFRGRKVPQLVSRPFIFVIRE
jgi:TonB family protein